jgi:hypothetical protein
MFAKQVVDLHKGILTAVYYPKRLHRHRAFAEKYAANQVRPNSEWLAERVLSFPFRPYLSDAQIDRVCNGLSEALASELKSRLWESSGIFELMECVAMKSWRLCMPM